MRYITLFLLGCHLLAAQWPEIDIPYQKFVLDNGLTLIVHEDHKAPIVAVNIWYHVGSKNERPGKTGFAHLFEHLMFGGSQHAPGRYIEIMERIGATTLNGTTNADRTNYFENVPTPALDYALWHESDRMGYMLDAIDQKTLDLQRGVVQNEKRQGENQPYGVARQLLTENTYPSGHPYSWTTIGAMEDLSAASMSDVQQWFRTYYGPSNAVLVLAGDIDGRTALEKVRRYFGEIPPGPPVAKQRVWIAKRGGTHRQTVQDRVPAARIYKVWNTPEWGTRDAAYLDLVSDVLSQGRTSRLYKRLVYDDQSASAAAAYVNPAEIGGQFTISATARPGEDLRKVEKAIDEELQRFLDSGPTAQELERIKNAWMAAFIRGLERIGGFGGKSDRLASSQVFGGSPEAYKTTVRYVQEATAEDLKGTARRWLMDGDYILEVHPFPPYKGSAQKADRSRPPDPGGAPDVKLPRIQRGTLANGLKLMLAERHQIPVVNFWLAVDAGYAADQFATPGAASAVSALLTGGTKTRSALQISDEAGVLGAQLSARAGVDLSVVRLSAMKNKLDESMTLFADVILNPVFPPADFARQKKLQIADIQREKSTPVQMALRLYPALLYGPDHAYGNPLTGSGTEASVGKMQREELVKFHETWFRPNNATMVIVGDTTLAEITPKLEKLFGGWSRGETPHKNIGTVALASKPVLYLIDKPGAPQSVIFAGQIAPPRNNPREIAIEVMNNVLGGTFSSRINMNLREDKHWSYGAQSVFFGARGQRPFFALAPVQSDKTKESVAEMDKEMRGIIGPKPAAGTELANTRNNMALRLPGSRESVNEVGESMLDIVQYGLPDDYYDTYVQKVRAVSESEIADAAKSTIHPDRLTWIVVGDRAKVEPGLRELGIAEIRLIDAEGKPQ